MKLVRNRLLIIERLTVLFITTIVIYLSLKYLTKNIPISYYFIYYSQFSWKGWNNYPMVFENNILKLKIMLIWGTNF